ncbi:MAG: hypothetical protein ACLR2E_02675 [Lachnospiraceae bacterium]
MEIVIRNIMKTANCTAEQAMNLAGAPDDIRQMYKERFPDQTPHKTPHKTRGDNTILMSQS